MSAMLTMLATSAVFLFDGGCAVAVLFILVCGVALLQSRLINAAGHWTQHGASAIQLNNSIVTKHVRFQQILTGTV